MKERTFRILLVEDHPLILDAYKLAFKEIENNNPLWRFYIAEANSCDTAMAVFEATNPQRGFDLVFLDLKIPASRDKKILSGEDIGVHVRKEYLDSKLIIITTFDNAYRIQNIFRNINPEGFLVKSDITAKILVSAILDILQDTPYYSHTVLQAMRKNIANEFFLDDLDRKILYELSIGTKTSNLSKILPLSQATVERKKKNLKEVFDVQGDDDRDLLERARELGFI
ncbi:MAG TPA: hypothetical protein VFD78_01680 [Chitinophagaceae bacterium]|nr:hypothetical protein [Chitinophagaceae bacterium]